MFESQRLSTGIESLDCLNCELYLPANGDLLHNFIWSLSTMINLAGILFRTM